MSEKVFGQRQVLRFCKLGSQECSHVKHFNTLLHQDRMLETVRFVPLCAAFDTSSNFRVEAIEQRRKEQDRASRARAVPATAMDCRTSPGSGVGRRPTSQKGCRRLSFRSFQCELCVRGSSNRANRLSCGRSREEAARMASKAVQVLRLWKLRAFRHCLS